MTSSGVEGDFGNLASSVVACFLLENTPIPESAAAVLLSAVCHPGSAESEELLASGVAAKLCDAVVDAAAERIGGGGETSSTSTSSSSLLTSLRVLRNLCASGERAGDALASTGVARAAAVLSAAAAAVTTAAGGGGGGGGGGEGEREEGEGGGKGAAADAAEEEEERVSIAAAQLLANLATCSASGAEAVWREAVIAVAGAGAAASASAAPSSSSNSYSSFLAVAARQGGVRVAGPVASATDAALLQQQQQGTRKGARPVGPSAAAASDVDVDGGDASAAAAAAAELLCSSSLLAAVVDGLRLEIGTLHDDDDAEEEDEEDETRKSKRAKDAATTAVAARAVARLLRSLSFRFRGGFSLALEALKRGPPASKERVETALRLLGHVVAEEGFCFGSGLEFDGNSKKGDSDDEEEEEEKSTSSSPFDSFAAAILEALDSPAASPGEVEACLALLREVAAREDSEGEEKGSSSPSSSTSVVAALVRAGLVPRLLGRISDLPPVRGQEEAEAESEAKKEEDGEEEREGGEDERRKEQRKQKQKRRRLPRYPEERADSVAVLANALHRRPYVAESLLACDGGAELLLAQCGAVGAEEAGEGEWRRRQEATRENNTSPPPSRNPLPPTVGAFAREWALWALRNLTEVSEEARELLSSLRPVRAVPSAELERVGLRLELDEGSGKFELRKIGEEKEKEEEKCV